MNNKNSTVSTDVQDRLKSNKLADLIWTIYENSKKDSDSTHTIQFGEIQSSFNGKELPQFILRYVDSTAMFEQPFLSVENATTQVIVTPSDFHYFIESLNAKNIAIELIPLQPLPEHTRECGEVRSGSIEIYSESKELIYTFISLIVGLIVVVSSGLLGSFASPWIPFFTAMSLVGIGVVVVNRVLDKKV